MPEAASLHIENIGGESEGGRNHAGSGAIGLGRGLADFFLVYVWRLETRKKSRVFVCFSDPECSGQLSSSLGVSLELQR